MTKTSEITETIQIITTGYNVEINQPQGTRPKKYIYSMAPAPMGVNGWDMRRKKEREGNDAIIF